MKRPLQTRGSLLLCSLSLLAFFGACEGPPSRVILEAPHSEKEQIQAIKEAATLAEEEGAWVRAEVAIQFLSARSPSNLRLRSRLRKAQRRRRAMKQLQRLNIFVETGAWALAWGELDELQKTHLTPDELQTLQDLKEMLEETQGHP